ncbi:MAG: hypothetical protein GXY23_00290 [Myxococcales bacterium]|nr:hypothetical protein [Myxococcales bacterium]
MNVRTCAALASLLWATACTPLGDPALPSEGFFDDFERDAIGDAYRSTAPAGVYKIVDGELRVQGARNRPLWLARRLPDDVRVEFTVRSESASGDIKVELFGDGVSKATSESYTATGYVVIFGGWNNSLNVVARLDEHGADRVVGPKLRVEPGKTYRFAIERRGSLLTVHVDGVELMRFDDPEPLRGRGHDHFAFNDWEAKLAFDDLRITPL